MNVEKLGLFEKIERLAERFGLPHVPEHELSYFRTLRRSELAAALAAAPGKTAADLARRGRLKRVSGDLGGALADFQAALDLEPDLAAAHAGLGEAELERPEALESLSRAIDRDPSFPWAWLWRGAARLLAGDAACAKSDLERFCGLLPETGLGFLLLGVAEERLRKKRRAYEAYARAWKNDPVCSAACLLASRAAPSFKEELKWFHRAYDVSPVLGFITLQIHQTTDVDAPAYVRKIRRFCFERAETVGAYYQREATQSHFSHFPAEDYAFVSRLVARHPELSWAQAFYGRAACYTPSGAPEGVRHLSRAVALQPKAGWARAWRANARRLMGERDAALADFSDAIRLQPFYHRSFVWRASLLRKLGRLKEALADLDRALPMDPHYSLTYHERSLTRRGLGDLAGAAWDLDRAFLLDHRYHWAFKTGGPPSPQDLAAGRAQLTAGLRKSPTVPSLWVWRGQLSLLENALSAALLDFERACELDPHHALGHGWAGCALLACGRPEKAAERLRRAVTLEPKLWIARLWLARAERAAGRKSRAAAVLRETLAGKPTTPWAHCELAAFAREEGRLEEAEKQLARALLLDGKYPEAYLLLSQVRLERGRAAGALDAAQRCVDVAGNLGRAYAARAAALQALGRHEQALADYRRLLVDFPYLLNGEQRAAAEALLGAR
jgi:tetratricopeptide (TPR) repeat protein